MRQPGQDRGVGGNSLRVLVAASPVEWEMTALRRETLPSGATRVGSGALWILILTGSVTLETAAEQRPVRPGDAILVDRRTAHRLTADAESELVHADLRPVGPSVALPSPLVLRGFDAENHGIVALVTSCQLEARCATRPFATAYANLLGATMAAAHASREGHDSGEAAAPSVDSQVTEVVAALSARPGERWTLDRMADLVHLSRSSLTERFRRATGHSPMRMVREARMARARKLLADECLPVTHVAYEVGYGSVAAFSRAFAADHGVSPVAWRSMPDRASHVTPRTSVARNSQEGPAEPGGRGRAGADQQQRLDTVAVQ